MQNRLTRHRLKLIAVVSLILALVPLLSSCSFTSAEAPSSKQHNLLGLTFKDTPEHLRRKTKLMEPEWKDFTSKPKPEKKPGRGKTETGTKTSASNSAALSRANADETLLFAHYMPWFQTPEVSGYWGNHWTMNTCNPETIDENGQRDICAHYYPLIGPYDSSDPDLIDLHITLMKLAGIDGILVDWYGIIDAFDWGVLRDATDLIMKRFSDAGMKVGIVYEDYTIEVALQYGLIEDGITAGQEVMTYLEETYFSLENYVHIGETPLLLNYGPIHFTRAPQWNALFSVLEGAPSYAGLGYIEGVSATTFPWIEWPDGRYLLEDYYAWVAWAGFDLSIGSAYFGFHDYYAEGGWGEGLYELPDPTGTRFADLLAYNASQNPDIIQLNTWNDFGEGTMLEPTAEFGYKYLEDLQAFTGVPYARRHLELATEYYLLQKDLDGLRPASTRDFRQSLLRGDVSRAAAIVEALR